MPKKNAKDTKQKYIVQKQEDQLSGSNQSYESTNVGFEPGAAVNSIGAVVNNSDNTSGESQDTHTTLIETFIDDIKKRLTGAAESIYKTIKSKFNIKSSFYVPERNNFDTFQSQMDEILENILNFILSLQDDQSKVRISVSLCFETDTAKKHVNAKEEDTLGVYVPYASISNYQPVQEYFKACPPGTGKLKFVVNTKNNFYKACLKIKPLKERTNMPHGGIPFSERCIKRIDFTDGEVSPNNTYDELCPYMPYDNLKPDELMKCIIKLFDDGSQKNYPNEPIHKRCQLIVIPLECKTKGNPARRFGYLQVVGYAFPNTNDPKGPLIMTDFLGNKNDTKAKLIISILKYYAQYIVLSDKIESIQKIDTAPLQNLSLTYKK